MGDRVGRCVRAIVRFSGGGDAARALPGNHDARLYYRRDHWLPDAKAGRTRVGEALKLKAGETACPASVN